MTDLLKISKQVNDLLKTSGWIKDPHFNNSSILKLWSKKKYVLSNAAVQFVNKFDGLKLKHEAYRSTDFDYSLFNAMKATQEIDPSWVFDIYNTLADSTLTPIGQGYSEHLTYFISDNYKFYGGYDDYFCLIGDSTNAFFENILFYKEFKQL